MWATDQISIEIEDADHPVAVVVIATPAGTLSLIGGISIIGRVMRIDRAHVEGLEIGRARTSRPQCHRPQTAGSRRCRRNHHSGRHSNNRSRTKEKSPARSGSPVRLVLRAEEIEKPVTVARLLARYGMSLRKAHEVLNRLADGETVAVELGADDAGGVVSELSALGVRALPIAPPEPDVKRIRERLGLSQSEFSSASASNSIPSRTGSRAAPAPIPLGESCSASSRRIRNASMPC